MYQTIPYDPLRDGNFRTRKFKQIFPDTEGFIVEYQGSDLAVLNEKDLRVLYALLYAHYGNSNIANSDENQFKYQVWSTIFMYGPSWSKEIEVQKALRDLSIEELQIGGKAIYNSAANPSTQFSTGNMTELNYINNQNVTNYKKSKIDAYATLISTLKNDVTKRFIDKFRKLFVIITQPDYPLWFVTTPEEQAIIDQED